MKVIKHFNFWIVIVTVASEIDKYVISSSKQKSETDKRVIVPLRDCQFDIQEAGLLSLNYLFVWLRNNSNHFFLLSDKSNFHFLFTICTFIGHILINNSFSLAIRNLLFFSLKKSFYFRRLMSTLLLQLKQKYEYRVPTDIE